MEFKQTVLDNGLTVIAEVMASARSIAVGFFVRTGSRDETPEVAGASHFLEHMLFNGTDTRSAIEVNLEFDAMGAKNNAFTSEENTVYYAAVLPEFQQQVLTLWADLMRPALRDEDFDIEKGVILEEIAMYQDLPQFDVMDRGRKLYFGDHQCGNSVLGSVESIQALTSSQMREYFNRRYAPDNIVLVTTGQVDWDSLVRQANQLCGQWQASGPKRSLSDYRGVGKTDRFKKEQLQREHIWMMMAGPSLQDDLRFEASVLSNIIGDDTNSRLYWSLIDTAHADSADMECDSMDGTGAYCVYVSCDPDKADDVIQTVQDELAKVKNEGITEQELEASKNKICSAMTLNGELPMGRLVPLGFGWTYRKEYRPLAKDIQRIQDIGREDIHRLLESYPLDNITIQRLGPK